MKKTTRRFAKLLMGLAIVFSINILAAFPALAQEAKKQPAKEAERPKLDVTFVDVSHKGVNSPDGLVNFYIRRLYSFLATSLGYDLNLNLRPMRRIDQDFVQGETAFVLTPGFQMVGLKNLKVSEPIFCYSYSIVSKVANPVHEINDLQGKRLSYVLAKTFADEYKKQINNGEGKELTSFQVESGLEALRMLAFDRADAVLITTLIYNEVLKLSEEESGIPPHLMAQLSQNIEVEWVRASVYIHPKSPIYHMGDEVVDMINELGRTNGYDHILSPLYGLGLEPCTSDVKQ